MSAALRRASRVCSAERIFLPQGSHILPPVVGDAFPQHGTQTLGVATSGDRSIRIAGLPYAAQQTQKGRPALDSEPFHG